MDSHSWRVINWANASILTKPKREGGLGFKDFRMFNMALLVRQGWRMVQNPDQLWVKLLKGLYFHNVDFLVASKSRYPSWVWSNLCDSRQILWNGELKNLVNGASIRVGEDPWIPTLPDFR
ncbi:Uncharacterized mitochondrial protein AtMg00310, partial [Linum perenne]